MLTSFSVKNYRCFGSLNVGPLARLNLITGRNNVGKTALLEALYLYGRPGIAQDAALDRVLRAKELPESNTHELWKWMFRGGAIDETVILRGECPHEQPTSVSMSLRRVEHVHYSREAAAHGVGEPVRDYFPDPDPRELVIEFRAGDEIEATLRASVDFKGPYGHVVTVETRSPTAPGTRHSHWVSLNGGAREQTETLFSELVRSKRAEQLLAPLRLLEPRLRDLQLLRTAGVTVVNADIGLGELLPLPLLGGGMNRLLVLLLAALQRPPVLLVVDEIENGFHHSVLIDVWRALGEAAKAADAQVVATTHSWECVQAAHEAFRQQPGVFGLHRLARWNDDVVAHSYTNEALSAAVASFLEVR